jgi:hypothetical protein
MINMAWKDSREVQAVQEEWMIFLVCLWADEVGVEPRKGSRESSLKLNRSMSVLLTFTMEKPSKLMWIDKGSALYAMGLEVLMRLLCKLVLLAKEKV